MQLKNSVRVLDCLTIASTLFNGSPAALEGKHSLLMSKSGLLAEYFSICIDDKGNLVGLPELLYGYRPLPEELPVFLWSLCSVPWDSEYACFDGIANVLGLFYSKLSTDEEMGGEVNVEANNFGKRLTKNGQHTLELVLLPALKQFLIAGKDCEDMGFITQLASLEQLYKVFERC